MRPRKAIPRALHCHISHGSKMVRIGGPGVYALKHRADGTRFKENLDVRLLR